MITLIKGALTGVIKKFIVAALSEKALKVVVIAALEKLAKSTENTLDDVFVEEIKKAL